MSKMELDNQKKSKYVFQMNLQRQQKQLQQELEYKRQDFSKTKKDPKYTRLQEYDVSPLYHSRS